MSWDFAAIKALMGSGALYVLRGGRVPSSPDSSDCEVTVLFVFVYLIH